MKAAGVPDADAPTRPSQEVQHLHKRPRVEPASGGCFSTAALCASDAPAATAEAPDGPHARHQQQTQWRQPEAVATAAQAAAPGQEGCVGVAGVTAGVLSRTCAPQLPPPLPHATPFGRHQPGAGPQHAPPCAASSSLPGHDEASRAAADAADAAAMPPPLTARNSAAPSEQPTAAAASSADPHGSGTVSGGHGANSAAPRCSGSGGGDGHGPAASEATTSARPLGGRGVGASGVPIPLPPVTTGQPDLQRAQPAPSSTGHTNGGGAAERGSGGTAAVGGPSPATGGSTNATVFDYAHMWKSVGDSLDVPPLLIAGGGPALTGAATGPSGGQASGPCSAAGLLSGAAGTPGSGGVSGLLQALSSLSLPHQLSNVITTGNSIERGLPGLLQSPPGSAKGGASSSACAGGALLASPIRTPYAAASHRGPHLASPLGSAQLDLGTRGSALGGTGAAAGGMRSPAGADGERRPSGGAGAGGAAAAAAAGGAQDDGLLLPRVPAVPPARRNATAPNAVTTGACPVAECVSVGACGGRPGSAQQQQQHMGGELTQQELEDKQRRHVGRKRRVAVDAAAAEEETADDAISSCGGAAEAEGDAASQPGASPPIAPPPPLPADCSAQPPRQQREGGDQDMLEAPRAGQAGVLAADAAREAHSYSGQAPPQHAAPQLDCETPARSPIASIAGAPLSQDSLPFLTTPYSHMLASPYSLAGALLHAAPSARHTSAASPAQQLPPLPVVGHSTRSPPPAGADTEHAGWGAWAAQQAAGDARGAAACAGAGAGAEAAWWGPQPHVAGEAAASTGVHAEGGAAAPEHAVWGTLHYAEAGPASYMAPVPQHEQPAAPLQPHQHCVDLGPQAAAAVEGDAVHAAGCRPQHLTKQRPSGASGASGANHLAGGGSAAAPAHGGGGAAATAQDAAGASAHGQGGCGGRATGVAAPSRAHERKRKHVPPQAALPGPTCDRVRGAAAAQAAAFGETPGSPASEGSASSATSIADARREQEQERQQQQQQQAPHMEPPSPWALGLSPLACETTLSTNTKALRMSAPVHSYGRGAHALGDGCSTERLTASYWDEVEPTYGRTPLAPPPPPQQQQQQQAPPAPPPPQMYPHAHAPAPAVHNAPPHAGPGLAMEAAVHVYGVPYVSYTQHHRQQQPSCEPPYCEPHEPLYHERPLCAPVWQHHQHDTAACYYAPAHGAMEWFPHGVTLHGSACASEAAPALLAWHAAAQAAGVCMDSWTVAPSGAEPPPQRQHGPPGPCERGVDNDDAASASTRGSSRGADRAAAAASAEAGAPRERCNRQPAPAAEPAAQAHMRATASAYGSMGAGGYGQHGSGSAYKAPRAGAAVQEQQQHGLPQRLLESSACGCDACRAASLAAAAAAAAAATCAASAASPPPYARCPCPACLAAAEAATTIAYGYAPALPCEAAPTQEAPPQSAGSFAACPCEHCRQAAYAAAQLPPPPQHAHRLPPPGPPSAPQYSPQHAPAVSADTQPQQYPPGPHPAGPVSESRVPSAGPPACSCAACMAALASRAQQPEGSGALVRTTSLPMPYDATPAFTSPPGAITPQQQQRQQGQQGQYHATYAPGHSAAAPRAGSTGSWEQPARIENAPHHAAADTCGLPLPQQAPAASATAAGAQQHSAPVHAPRRASASAQCAAGGSKAQPEHAPLPLPAYPPSAAAPCQPSRRGSGGAPAAADSGDRLPAPLPLPLPVAPVRVHRSGSAASASTHGRLPLPCSRNALAAAAPALRQRSSEPRGASARRSRLPLPLPVAACAAVAPCQAPRAAAPAAPPEAGGAAHAAACAAAPTMAVRAGSAYAAAAAAGIAARGVGKQQVASAAPPRAAGYAWRPGAPASAPATDYAAAGPLPQPAPLPDSAHDEDAMWAEDPLGWSRRGGRPC